MWSFVKNKNYGTVIEKINLSIITNGRNVAFFRNRHNNRYPLNWKVFLWEVKIDNIFKQRCEYCWATLNYKTRYIIQCDWLRGSKAFYSVQNVQVGNGRQVKKIIRQYTRIITHRRKSIINRLKVFCKTFSHLDRLNCISNIYTKMSIIEINFRNIFYLFPKFHRLEF